MRTTKTNDLADRRSAAADAKAALLRAYRATREAAEPTRIARQEELLAIAAARDERREERDRLKTEARAQQEEQTRVEAEAAAYQEAAAVAARARIAAREKADSLIAQVIKDEDARKADRDRRYADRKARQK
ncbi:MULTISPECIES: DUF6481 family protein [unclassified Paracoccus (in: a-proteobacteria)]|uniref:DUF6481 family protein n=1 Tax=unclassified Paracoccus (in: a-proteobacteria) TaxID=2688777 RepID=UPI0015FF1F15|nr:MULTISPECIES: DUF6481 family protein [unclassified Paracoccus (in: a-proteobacteria)]MBB1493352.1 hypothetical protein [Paracoccus sp. MC1854]MBB1499716.1 hypothetical protein [Paracoccus sp. MC1862]QQO45323.1 hypothetical protein JGR78_02870 [Paracoccus sp. MC1862]